MKSNLLTWALAVILLLMACEVLPILFMVVQSGDLHRRIFNTQKNYIQQTKIAFKSFKPLSDKEIPLEWELEAELYVPKEGAHSFTPSVGVTSSANLRRIDFYEKSTRIELLDEATKQPVTLISEDSYANFIEPRKTVHIKPGLYKFTTRFLMEPFDISAICINSSKSPRSVAADLKENLENQKGKPWKVLGRIDAYFTPNSVFESNTSITLPGFNNGFPFENISPDSVKKIIHLLDTLPSCRSEDER